MIELRCLSRRALIGELTLERRALFAGTLLGPISALNRGLGALLGAGGALVSFAGELVAALGVFPRSGGFSFGAASACFGVVGQDVGLVAFVFGDACALERVVALLLSPLGALALARGSLGGLPAGGLRGRLGGDGGLRAGDRVLRATLGVLSERLRVALSRFGIARAVTGCLFGRLCLRRGRQRSLGGVISLEAVAAGGRLELGGA